MSQLLKREKIRSPFGIFLQFSVFAWALWGLFNLAKMLFYSLTSYDMLTKPSFIGFANYSSALSDEIVRRSLSNTTLMVISVAVLLLLTAVLPAVFTAKLKLPFGLGIMAAYFIISLCSMFTNCFGLVFSGDAYGLINSLLLNARIITEPIAFAQTHAPLISVIAMWLYCLAPVFAITYLAARKKHSFSGAAIALCAIPVLMFNGGNIVMGIVGLPSTNYSADWIYTIFYDYLNVRYNIGFAYAILGLGLLMLIGWCLTVSAIVFGLWALCKRVNPKAPAFKKVGFITFALSSLLFVVALIFIILYFSKAFMPIEEIFTFPSFLPKQPTFKNFSDLSKMTSSSFMPFSKYLYNSLFAVPLRILPVCLTIALPSGVGFALFKVCKHQKLFLCCFIPLLFASSYITSAALKTLDTYSVYTLNFISSFELLVTVFLVYLAVKLVFYTRKPRISTILYGSFFLLTSFYAIGAIRGIWYTANSAIYSEGLKIWKDVSNIFSSAGIARCGIAAANDFLMLLATLVVVIIPLLLLLRLYLDYRRNTNALYESK